MIITEVLMVVAITFLFICPGCALLMLINQWHDRPFLHQLLLSTSLGVVTYPILFYGSRSWGTINRPFLLGWLALCSCIILYFVWRRGFRFTRPGYHVWITLGILLLTFWSRFQFAHDWPFPAWSDSLHHTLLTQLTADTGQLPTSLEPYFPNTLNMYHLGLYAISGSVSLVANISADQALLWSTQFLNAMCGFGIFLILDRHVGRVGAITGLAVAGLFSVHPALWGNWGRYTQLTAVVILPVAWFVFVELLDRWDQSNADKRQRWGHILLASLFSAAVFLCHFRVAIFYAALLVPTIALWIMHHNLKQVLAPSALVAGFSFLLILPVVQPAMRVYVENSRIASTNDNEPNPDRQENYDRYFNRYPLKQYPYLVAPLWLLGVASLAGAWGLWRRQWITWLAAIWTLLLMGLGYLYLLNIPILNVTNLFAILIMLYLPIALVIGVAAQSALTYVPQTSRAIITTSWLLILLLTGLPAAYARATRVEQERHFMTADDLTAMAWINENAPQDARFGINHWFWFSDFAHGNDAGFWIPYWTGRQITTSSMLTAEVSEAYKQQRTAWSQMVGTLETDLDVLDELHASGVDYLYLGSQGGFRGTVLQRDALLQSDWVELVFEVGETSILQIRPPQIQDQ